VGTMINANNEDTLFSVIDPDEDPIIAASCTAVTLKIAPQRLAQPLRVFD
jgi:hypothetical protein